MSSLLGVPILVLISFNDFFQTWVTPLKIQIPRGKNLTGPAQATCL